MNFLQRGTTELHKQVKITAKTNPVHPTHTTPPGPPLDRPSNTPKVSTLAPSLRKSRTPGSRPTADLEAKPKPPNAVIIVRRRRFKAGEGSTWCVCSWSWPRAAYRRRRGARRGPDVASRSWRRTDRGVGACRTAAELRGNMREEQRKLHASQQLESTHCAQQGKATTTWGEGIRNIQVLKVTHMMTTSNHPHIHTKVRQTHIPAVIGSAGRYARTLPTTGAAMRGPRSSSGTSGLLFSRWRSR